MTIKKIKQQIISDDNFANALQYVFSKVINDNPISSVRVKYKKHKVVLNKNGLFSIHRMDGTKLYSNIKYQEVAQYVVENLKRPNKCSFIIAQEKELERFRDKVVFYSRLYKHHQKDHIKVKLNYTIDRYNLIKRGIDEMVKLNKL